MNDNSIKDRILIGKTKEEFVNIAVDTIFQELLSASDSNVVLALSGGSTPIPIYEKLGDLIANSNVDPRKIFLIWIDERWVPHDAEGSNYKLAKNTLLKSGVIPEENIYPMPTMLENPQEAITIYEKTLNDLYKKLDKKINFIDLSIMGIGSDGHTASLFPGIYELKDINNKNWVIVPFVKKLGVYRISLTPKLINSSKTIIYLVKGKEKASIVEFLMTTKNIIHYPVQLIKPENGKIIWILDVDAFSEVGEVIKYD